MTFHLSQDQIIEDILYLHDVISKNNPFKFLKKRTHNVDWDGMKDDFVAMAKAINADSVYLQKVNNWGTFDETEFFDIDVTNPKNENFEEAKYFIEIAMKEQGIIVEQNCFIL